MSPTPEAAAQHPVRTLERADGAGDSPVVDVAAVAAAHCMDPRLAAAAPGFDAPFQQAGLAGYSDLAMRILAREMGCPYAITEALLDRLVIEGSPRTDSHPDGLFPLHARAEGAADRPLAVQLMGSEPATMAAAARRLVELTSLEGPRPGRLQAIDVNLACPVKKVSRKRRGGHWLAEPEGAVAILRAVREAVPAGLVTTVKLRRGTDDSPDAEARFRQVFDAAYQLGYSWATVHARTVEQRYVGASRWPFLRRLVRDHPERVILGSGDIWIAEDIFRMLHLTGVSAVSVARGCIGNPWIFRQARDLMAGQPPQPPSLAEQRAVLLRHFELAVAVHGEAKASLTMRKFGVRFAVHHPDATDVKRGLSRVRDAEAWRRVVDEHYPDTHARSGPRTALED